MQRFILISCAILITASPLFADRAAPAAKGKWVGCTHSRYKAQQIGKTVVIVGHGTHPTSGYQTRFRQLPIRIFPPQFAFEEQKPDGITLQVLTPFAEIAHFTASAAVKSVVIHDGNGKHTVKVTPSKTDSGKGTAYLTPDGKLASRLLLRDSQSGFAGVTGYVWTIETDGAWQRQTFINRTVRKADESGKLSAVQLKKLAAALAENDLRTLPRRLGGKPMVNPKVVTLSFGKTTSEFVMRGGDRLPKVGDGRERTVDERFAGVVAAVKSLLVPARSR